MRVGVNARLLASPNLRGWSRYTVNLLRELPSLGVELVLYSDRELHPRQLARLPEGSYRVQVSSAGHYPHWEQVWLSRQAKRDEIDILHSPLNFGLPWSRPVPSVLTLHDAIGRAFHGTSWLRALTRGDGWTHLSHWITRRVANRIITPSEHAKRDIVHHFRIADSRITVVPEAADPIFHHAIGVEQRDRVRKQFGLDRPFILYVGGWEERKNIAMLVRSFAAIPDPDGQLVLAGGRPGERDRVAALVAELGIGQTVHLLGWVDDEVLPALFAEANCFVYPSLYEGFGLQLCEAMAVGCPILAANATSLPEVLGDGGDLFDPHDGTDLTRQLTRILTDESCRTELAARATARGRAFSWRATAERTLDVYREAVRAS
jgi:glycosyltransferase involved in cell wall biosynthesis